MTEYDPGHAAEHHSEIHSHVPSEPALRVKALESLLIEKGLVDPDAVGAWVELYRDEVGPKVGARVVARAWNDEAKGSEDRPLAISRSLRIPTSSTTSSFARCAPAIPTGCWVYSHLGTRKRPTGRARFASPASC